MKDKLRKLIDLISDNRDEIRDITQSSREYYFHFRGRVFSISSSSSTSKPGFFVYPKWSGSPRQLVDRYSTGEESGDTTFVFLANSDVPALQNGKTVITDLYDWLDSKNLGLDKLFEDMGID